MSEAVPEWEQVKEGKEIYAFGDKQEDITLSAFVDIHEDSVLQHLSSTTLFN